MHSCALKVNLMKAYDTVRWDFVGVVLNILGFPERVVQWIRECISTPRFYISINGELNGFFPGERGLRQGDPMSHTSLFWLWKHFLGCCPIWQTEGDLDSTGGVLQSRRDLLQSISR